MDATTKDLIPILRFPEFKEPWEAKKISQLTSRLINPVSVDLDGEYREIGIRSHGKGLFHKQKITGSSLGNKRVFWVKPNCFIVNIVFAWEQAIAKTTEAELGFIASHRFPMYKPLISKANVDFLVYFFKRKKGKNILELASPGGAGRNKTLGQKEFEKTKLIVPKVVEQQKIANFLVSVDIKIQQLKRKHTLTQQYKKGVMQQLFSQQVRFKDDAGRDYPDWEKQQLKKAAKINPKNHALPSEFTYIDLESVVKGRLIKRKRLLSEVAPSRAQRVMEKKDILFQMVRPYQQNNYFFDLKGEYVASTGYAQLRTNNEAQYIFQYMHTGEFVKEVLVRCTGSSYPAINSSDLGSVPIYIPSLEEQRKIAEFLKSIDKKIEQLNTQITKAEVFKKGLLQKMFV